MCLVADGNIVFLERGVCAGSSRGGWRVVVEAAEVDDAEVVVEDAEVEVEAAEVAVEDSDAPHVRAVVVV